MLLAMFVARTTDIFCLYLSVGGVGRCGGGFERLCTEREKRWTKKKKIKAILDRDSCSTGSSAKRMLLELEGVL